MFWQRGHYFVRRGHYLVTVSEISVVIISSRFSVSVILTSVRHFWRVGTGCCHFSDEEIVTVTVGRQRWPKDTSKLALWRPVVTNWHRRHFDKVWSILTFWDRLVSLWTNLGGQWQSHGHKWQPHSQNWRLCRHWRSSRHSTPEDIVSSVRNWFKPVWNILYF